MLLLVVVTILSLVLALAGAGLIATSTLWLVSRRRVAQLRRQVRALETGTGSTIRHRSRRLVPRPDEAVKAIWDTATLMRDKGVGGALRTSISDLAGWAQVERPDLVELAVDDGQVAILFSDIEGSTAKNDELGDRAWVRVLRAHDRILRNHIERRDGTVVKTQGDGFMVAFSSAESATRCAVDVQRSLDRGRAMGKAAITVRVGIHYGSVVHRENDIFGRNVALAARVAALADGAQILVSEPVAERIAGSDLQVGEPWSVQLKGLPGDHLVAAVEWRT